MDSAMVIFYKFLNLERMGGGQLSPRILLFRTLNEWLRPRRTSGSIIPSPARKNLLSLVTTADFFRINSGSAPLRYSLGMAFRWYSHRSRRQLLPFLSPSPDTKLLE